MAFGEAVARLRKARSWTQADLAAASNGELNIGTIGSVERGRQDNPTQKTLERFARAFSITVPELRREAGLDPTLMELRAEGVLSSWLEEWARLEHLLSSEDKAALLRQGRALVDNTPKKTARRKGTSTEA